MGKNTIIATSCMDARNFTEQPVWRHIADEQPALLLLLGDQIYMDGDSAFDVAVGGARARYKKPWENAKSSAAKQAVVGKFGRDMHARYAEQWAIASFRKCVTQIRDHGGRVLLTWDDHDFAWNNSCGAGSLGEKKVVPEPFKDMAYKLFVQFANQVRAARVDAAYPAFEQAITPESGHAAKFEIDALPDIGVTVGLALLDSRSERQPHTAGSTMIGTTQQTKLLASVKANKDLLIVASGSPLARKNKTDVSWWQGGSASVAELKPFQDAAKAADKPVIYIGGDIHKNELIGFPFAGVPIFEVLASGAAKQAGQGNYVLITINAPTITLDSRVLSQDGAGVVTQTTKLLNLNQWMTNVQSVGNAAPQAEQNIIDSHAPDVDEDAEPSPAQAAALAHYKSAVSTSIKATAVSFSQAVFRKLGGALVVGSNDLATLADAFIDELPAAGDLYTASFDEKSAAAKFEISNDSSGRIAALASAMELRSSDDPPLVIYVHGFNNSFNDAVVRSKTLEKLYGLRSSVATNIVGIFSFSWPAGKNRWLLDAPTEFQQAMARLPDAAGAFTTLVADIGKAKTALEAASKAPRKLVLLARSTGAWLLETAVLPTGSNVASQIKVLFECVVLSQPLTNAKTHKKWVEKINLPTYVTINTKDSILLSAQNLLSVVRPLGCNRPSVDQVARNAVYLDTTYGTLVNADHGVIMRNLQTGKFADPSLYGFHQYALHGKDANAVRSVLRKYAAFTPVANFNDQLWETLPVDDFGGAA